MLSEISYGQIAMVIGSLLVSLGFHEAMHAFAAHRLGDDTAAQEGRLTLNPLKHIDLITTVLLPLVMMLAHLPPILVARPVPFDPRRVRFGEYGSALVAVAGPVTNLLLAAVGALILRSGILAGPFTDQVLGIFIVVNISLFVFNMLPIPPLDGSRLLYAFAPVALQRVMAQIEALGFFITITILFLLIPFISPILNTVNNALLTFLL